MELGPKTCAAVVAETPKSCATPEPDAAREVPTAGRLPPVTHCGPCLAPVLATSTAGHSTRAQIQAQPRLSLEEFLLADVLEVILGFLDRKTLCTARLVSKGFCTAASVHICRLTHRGKFLAVSRQRFPRLARVTLHVFGKGERWAQVDPCLLELVTTLGLWGRRENCQALITETLSHLALMPKLRELKVDFDSEGMAAVLHQCTNLENISLIFGECSFPVAMSIASMTSLTQLHIGRVCQPGDWAGFSWDRPSAEGSWLRHFTALRKLQALHITTPSEALPFIGNLTGLTGLTWTHGDTPLFEEEVPYSLAPLTRLTRLRSVSFPYLTLSESNVDIACSLGAGSLADFALKASCDCGRFLTRQTALTRLSVDEHLCNLQHIAALRLELLQSLELERLTSVGGEDLSALRSAPILTRLVIGIVTNDDHSTGRALVQLPALDLSQTLAGLTQLCDLGLSVRYREPSAKLLDYPLAVGPLTGLTRLHIFWGKLDNQDLRALLGLTSLRILWLTHSCLTDEVVPELTILTSLSSLRLSKSGVTSLAPVTDVLNPPRAARGWPPMGAYI